MSSTVVTFVSVASIVTFAVVAQLSRARGLALRGETLVRSRGLAHYVAYFFFIPYVVIGVRPGPELDLPELLRWIGLVLIVAGVMFSIWAIATLGGGSGSGDRQSGPPGHVDIGGGTGPRSCVVRGQRRSASRTLTSTRTATATVPVRVTVIAGTLLVTYPALYLRAVTEERLLRERFGAAYAEYAREVGMLVPLL